MSNLGYFEYLKTKITKDNFVALLDTFGFLFENGIIVKQHSSSISITYASSKIYNEYNTLLLNVLSAIYQIKSTGSYKMMGHHSIIYYYYLS